MILKPVELHHSFTKHEATLVLAESFDMQSCVDYCTAIDPDVERIHVLSPEVTAYAKKGNEWIEFRYPKNDQLKEWEEWAQRAIEVFNGWDEWTRRQAAAMGPSGEAIAPGLGQEAPS